MSDFFSNMMDKSLKEIDDDARAKIQEIQKQQEDAHRAIKQKAVDLESSITRKFDKMISLRASTEECANNIDRLVTSIMDNAVEPSGNIKNFDSFNLGVIDESDDWTEYDSSYVSGYEVIGNLLIVTLNFSYQNSGSYSKVKAPTVDYNYLTYLLSQKGLLFERINKDGKSEPEIYSDVLNLFKIYCVRDIYFKAHENIVLGNKYFGYRKP